jgi:uncharacterized protein (TIGR00730 family)
MHDDKTPTINLPEKDLPVRTLTPEEIQEDEHKNLKLIGKELKQGFDFLLKYDRSVSIFGSAKFAENDEHYLEAKALAKRISSELGYAIITGGGPGIMQAANEGAYEAGGDSLGLTIRLPHEQVTNPYVKDEVAFQYFFTRKTILTFAAEAYIFFPGGFGTLDEFFEILTLVQTKKIPKVPIILVGRDYWEPLRDFILDNVYVEHGAVDEEDLSLYRIEDDHDRIVDIIRKTPVQKWWSQYEGS